MSKVNVGIVGLGNMGRNHLRVLSTVPFLGEVDIWGAADPDREGVHQWAFREAEGLPMYLTLDQMLSDPAGAKFDAIIVASPTVDHYRSALAALEAGCHVLVEKPFCDTINHGVELQTKARAAGKLLMVGLVERFNPAVQVVKEWLKDFRQMGYAQPSLIEARRSGLVNFHPADGVASDLATHDIDVINYLMGEMDDASYGVKGLRAPVEATVAGVMSFPSGGVGVYTADWLSPTKVRKLRVVCPNGTFFVDYIAQTVDWHPVGLDPQPLEVRRDEPLKLELEYFIDHIVEVRPDEMNTVTAGLIAMQTLQRIDTNGR